MKRVVRSVAFCLGGVAIFSLLMVVLEHWRDDRLVVIGVPFLVLATFSIVKGLKVAMGNDG